MAEKRAREAVNCSDDYDTEESDRDSSSQDDMASIIASGKKKKVKKAKYKTKFSKEWQTKFPFVKACYNDIKDHRYNYFCSFRGIHLSCA